MTDSDDKDYDRKAKRLLIKRNRNEIFLRSRIIQLLERKRVILQTILKKQETIKALLILKVLLRLQGISQLVNKIKDKELTLSQTEADLWESIPDEVLLKASKSDH